MNSSDKTPLGGDANLEETRISGPKTQFGRGEEIFLIDIILKLMEWFRYLFAKRQIIIAAGILGGIGGFTYAYFQKPIYTAVTTFVLEAGESSSGGLGQYAGLASMVGVDLGDNLNGIFKGDNIIELYKSRTMIEKTLLSEVINHGEKILLIDRYIQTNKLREKWKNKPEEYKIQFRTNSGILNSKSYSLTRLQDSILGEVVKEIKKNYLIVSKPDKKLSIIKVEVKSKDETFSKLFNEQIVKNVNDFYVQTKTKKSLDNIAILQQKTDSVRSVMNNAIYTAAAVSDATPNLNITRQVQRSAPMQRSQFLAETNKAILAELVKNLEMSKISLRKETPLIQVVDQPVLPLEVAFSGKIKFAVIGVAIAEFLTLMVLMVKRVREKLNGII